MARNDFGWFGWFSAVGFVIMGALYLIDMVDTDLWQFPASWTLAIALLAGLGALALYFGNDPTSRDRRGPAT